MREPPEPQALADALVTTVRTAEEVDMRSYEERPVEALAEELLPTVLKIASEGLQAFEGLLRAYEPAGEPGLEEDVRNFYVEVDRLVEGDRTSHIADLAFMAHLELLERIEGLEGADSSWGRWRLLGECDSCLRRLRKAAAAVERAIALEAGLEPRLEHVTETSMGRIIRAYYARFRREVAGDAPPEVHDVHERLLSVAVSIAKLIGRDFYGELRVSDRAALRGLQDRLRSWLRGADGHDPQSGRRIWQDLNAFAGLLIQVNRRSELIEHDREIVARALEELDPAGDPVDAGDVSAAWLDRLGRLRGLSDAVDGLLAEPVTTDRATWLRELRRLERELGAGRASSTEAPPSGSTPGSRPDW